MTRKQRSQAGRNITYDLSNPRNLAAFQALLEDEAADEEGASSSSKPSKATRQQQQRSSRKREKEKFFMLRPEAVPDDVQSELGQGQGAAGEAGTQEEQVQQLLEMFEGAADRSLVADVYHASGCSLEAAADALFALLGGGPAAAGGAGASSSGSEPAGPLPAAGSPVHPAAPRSFAAAVGPSPASSSAASRAAAAALARQQQQHEASSSSSSAAAAAAAAAAAVSWCDLPPDVRSSILSLLTPQDLARAASTCGEFRDWANAMRAHVRRLVLQPGVSYVCVRGMVSSHVAAGVIDFSRYERHLPDLDPKELLPQVIAMHKAEAEASLFRGLLAVSEGSTTPCRTVPVTGLVLRGLVGLTDKVLAEALQSLKGLRSLDISHCPNITNKSLYLLAKYKATQGLDTQHQQ